MRIGQASPDVTRTLSNAESTADGVIRTRAKGFCMRTFVAMAFTLMLAIAYATPTLAHLGHIIRPTGCSCM
jgi:hypothetical protein